MISPPTDENRVRRLETSTTESSEQTSSDQIRRTETSTRPEQNSVQTQHPQILHRHKLKCILYAELQLTHCAGAQNVPEVPARERTDRVSPIGMIENVERLETELERMFFVIEHVEVFVDGHVEVDDAGSIEGVSPRFAEGSRRGIGKRCGIQPVLNRPVLRNDGGAGQVNAVVITVAIVDSRAVHTCVNAIRGAALQGGDGGNLPSADDAIHENIVRRPHLAIANGQIVNGRDHDAIFHVEVRRAVIAYLAIAVLRKELRLLGADPARVVQGFGKGV